MKFKTVATLCSAAALFALPALSSAQSSAAQLTSADRTFIHKAALAGNDEIALSKVAARKSTDPNIRQFAHKMIVQHSDAGAQLKQIAMSYGVTVPSGPDLQHRMIKLQLEMLSGRAFNRTYINDMVKDHTVADHLFQMGTTVNNGELRSFALNTLPVVEDHLKMASEMQQELKNGGSMASAM